MLTNLSKYESMLDDLISHGVQLVIAMRYKQNKEGVTEQIVVYYGEKSEQYIKDLPDFDADYQMWFTESQKVVSMIIPERLCDFNLQYDRQNRKSLMIHNYTIDDYLNRLTCWEFVKVELGFGRMEQQVAILRSARQRFTSSLFNINELITSDLFESEIVAARDLLDKKLLRAAGAVAGLVFKKHLLRICQTHNIKLSKKSTTILALNDLLRGAGIIEFWQFKINESLESIYAISVDAKGDEPTTRQVQELVDGVGKLIRTVL